ncbi:transcriptional regulator PpsR [Polynucleobacter sp. CS-Odin-A6]|uniref:transcriptional regulator PpsR n=1 Tax=Polynucleobacter sp. CS-Odin-A6 TaxID=2689106 RepID=UPI001C0BA279|nr:transcriptional regulator PpsR [Polynucleobacter sp. CS-Odin-A6]MBU3620426.1 transcriptional regulator PpsR [Polynucleobacter sp. CS-Odin-A6]
MPISQHPNKLFQDLSGKELSHIAQASADISFVLDDFGSIQDVYSHNESLVKHIPDDLIGKKWLEVVEPDSRKKVQYLLDDANPDNISKFRQINLSTNEKNIALPIMCASIKTLSNQKIVVIGRDLTPTAQLQQNLVAAQKEISQNQLQINQLEERFRSIFEIGVESIIIVEVNDGYPIVEMNGNAIKQLLLAKNHCVGKSFLSLLPADEINKVKVFLQEVLETSGLRVLDTFIVGDKELRISATSFINSGKPYLLLNLKSLDPTNSASLLESDSLAVKAIEDNAYGFIVCTPEGLILKANKAFIKLSNTKGEQELIGTSIQNYLGSETADFERMMQSLKGKASAQACVSSISNKNGGIKLVDISAVSVSQPRACIGMIFRQIDSRQNKDKRIDKKLVRSSEELSMLVGKVPLKEILAETTDLIEQLCIKAALDLTKDNRVSASEILGLSRQSLYIKLRKYGLVDYDIKDMD